MESTRRSFVGIVAALFSSVAAGSFTGSDRRLASPPPTPTPATPPSPAAEALARTARERYGKHLSEEEAKMLDARIAALERRGTRLRGYTLGNADEPALDFRAVRR